MENLKRTLLLLVLFGLVGCGTNSDDDVSTERFDMWNYMSATVNYEVEYDIYRNGKKMDYIIEKHEMFKDFYQKESSKSVVKLYKHSREIIMKEPLEEVSVERYAYVGDDKLFKAPSIKNCRLQQFYKNFKNKEMSYKKVIMVTCLSNSGVKKQIYYGYNEGVVTTYINDHGVTEEWVKVGEKQIK